VRLAPATSSFTGGIFSIPPYHFSSLPLSPLSSTQDRKACLHLPHHHPPQHSGHLSTTTFPTHSNSPAHLRSLSMTTSSDFITVIPSPAGSNLATSASPNITFPACLHLLHLSTSRAQDLYPPHHHSSTKFPLGTPLPLFLHSFSPYLPHYTPQHSYLPLGPDPCLDTSTIMDESETERIRRLNDEFEAEIDRFASKKAPTFTMPVLTDMIVPGKGLLDLSTGVATTSTVDDQDSFL
jgi:hypothetical protein